MSADVVSRTEDDFKRVIARIKALQDGSELARSQLELEQNMDAVVAAVRSMQEQIDEFPRLIEHFAEQVVLKLKAAAEPAE